MNIIILGQQGSGKGTQAELLAKKLGSRYLEMGDLLRKEIKFGSVLGKKIDEIVNQKGKLVPDQIVIKIARTWLNKREAEEGIVFDGYPRNLHQYQLLKKVLAEKGMNIDRVIFLKIKKDTTFKRLSSRRVCPRCDEEYNLVAKPPRKDGLCNRCQVRLIQRQDDKPKVIEKRLAAYQQLTQPLIEFIRREGILEEVDGEASIKEIHQEIMKRLEVVRAKK